MYKNYIFTALLTTVSLLSTGQTAPAIQWQKSLGGSLDDNATSIEQTSDGGYIAAGNSYSNDGDVSGNHSTGQFSDYWIVKLSSSGTIQWAKTLGGSSDDYANSVAQTSDGGYIIAGDAYSTDGDVTGNHGSDDYWIVKLSSSGSIQWQKCLGGSGGDGASSIKQTSDGGYIVAGNSNSNDGNVTGNHGDDDYWIVKLNSSGALQWQKNLGGSDGEGARSIKQTSDDGYIVAGYSFSNDGDVSDNHGEHDYWIVKLNSSGTIQWQKSLGGSNGEVAYSVEQTSDGGYIAAGFSLSDNGNVSGNHGLEDYWIVKLTSSGIMQWQNSMGGGSTDFANSIEQTPDNGYIVGGYSSSNDGDVSGNHGENDYWIVKLNNSGSIQWQNSMGGSGSEIGNSIEPTTDNGYIVAGLSSSNDGDVSGHHGEVFTYDYWIVKLEPDPLLPVSFIDFSGEVNGKQNLLHWTTATEQNNTGFEVQRSNDAINFSKIDFVNTKATEGISTLKLHYDYSDYSYVQVTNYYRLKQIDKDGKFTYSNILVLKHNNVLAPVFASVYPNPAKNILNVKIRSSVTSNLTLLITDPNGRLLLNKITNVGDGETIAQLDVSHLPAGTYFLKIICTDGCEDTVLQFVKQ